MSLKSWLKEFMPVAAKDTTKEEALDHSIRKWNGTIKAAMKKHKVKLDQFFDLESVFSTTTCALCVHYRNEHPDMGIHQCDECPLSKARGGTKCFMMMPDEKEDPWHEFTDNGNGLPMRRWLAKTKKMMEKAKKTGG